MNDIVIISGFSGAGKGTIVKQLLKNREDMAVVKSYTTRAVRDAEDAKAYIFVSEEEFLRLRQEDYFLESNNFDGNWYGTPRNSVVDNIESKTTILEIEVHGCEKVLNDRICEQAKVISMFVLPPNPGELYKRLKNRGTETDEKILERLRIAHNEISKVDMYDYWIVNDNLKDTLSYVENIIDTKPEPDKEVIDLDKFEADLEGVIRAVYLSLKHQVV